jgi:hypothetical protein
VAVSRSKDAADMKQRWLKSHPGLGMAFTIDARIAPYFPAPEQKK